MATVDETVRDWIWRFPEGYGSRSAVLHNIFCAHGNGFFWERGQLVLDGRPIGPLPGRETDTLLDPAVAAAKALVATTLGVVPETLYSEAALRRAEEARTRVLPPGALDGRTYRRPASTSSGPTRGRP